MNDFLGLSRLAPNDVSWLVAESLAQADLTVSRKAPLSGDQLQVVLVDWHDKRVAAGATYAKYEQHVEESFSAASAYLDAGFFSLYPQIGERIDDVIDTALAFCGFASTSPACIVIRHFSAGVAHQAAQLPIVRSSPCAIMNGGDGNNENPAEALAIMATLLTSFSDLRGLPAVFLGDAGGDPVARSLFFGLQKLGAEIHIFAPSVLAPKCLSDVPGVTLHHKPFKVAADAAFFLSPVKKTAFLEGILPSPNEYLRFFALNRILPSAAECKAFVMALPNTQNVEVLLPVSPRDKMPHTIDGQTLRYSVSARSAALSWSLLA